MKLTVIGAGNMGGATALGLLEKGAIAPANLTVTDANEAVLAKFKDKGANVTTDNKAAVDASDTIIIVVKPWVVPLVLEQIKDCDLSGKTVVCMAAGVKPEVILPYLKESTQLVYVIPNTAIEIGQAMIFVAPYRASKAATDAVADLFSKVGVVKQVAFANLGGGIALASCGIAYAMRYIRAAVEGGVELGFYPQDATDIVCQTVIGAASLIRAHRSHPEAEIDKVTTPGGMTIKGLNAMEEAGFTDAVIKGLKAGK
ncbi:MAG: NAD(P)-binding domain-containing protein [Bacteroidales bacterium]|nr:NAD(P)-binding domain-containing protein [Bacteroidales bacterium]